MTGENGTERSLGRIEGQLKGLEAGLSSHRKIVEDALREQRTHLGQMDEKIQRMEVESVKRGGIAGTIASVCVAIAGMLLNPWLNR